MSERTVTYSHIVIEGNPYQAGRQLGEILRSNERLVHFMSSPFMGGPALSHDNFRKVQKLYDRYCPGINEEISGFADGAGIAAENIVYYFAYLFPRKCNCSQVAVSPAITNDGHTYLGRNYDYGWDEEPILIESRIDGQYSQLGFACQLFGRFDGMNEKGLSIATSAGTINPPYEKEGFVFPVIVRALLNQCATVEEAIALFEDMPFADYRNFCMADAEGSIACIQAAASLTDIQTGGRTNILYTEKTQEYFLATNHYTATELKKKGFYVPMHSVTRYDAIKKVLDEKTLQDKKSYSDDLKALLSMPMEDGPCCHYYEDGMGTMWSAVFDATARTAQICFGSPDDHEWRRIGLHDVPGITRYRVNLSSQKAAENFWKNME